MQHLVFPLISRQWRCNAIIHSSIINRAGVHRHTRSDML
ncbi:hypothetical protein A1122_21015 [Yersinia pestis A1122]|nr:hypothetical protein A1122_21015 [Yersinia pestis A1122]